jgi:hypothetical protein
MENKMKGYIILICSILLFNFFLFCDSIERKSYADDNCPECKPGEKAITIIKTVGPGDYVYTTDPSCSRDMNNAINNTIRLLSRSKVPGISNFAGPILQAASNEIRNLLRQHVRGDFGRLLAPYSNPTANCVLVETMIPLNAKITAYRLEAYDNTGGGRCNPGVDCGIGWCKWAMYPVDNRVGDGRWVYSVFKNWSHNRTRTAKFTVYYIYQGPEIR